MINSEVGSISADNRLDTFLSVIVMAREIGTEGLQDLTQMAVEFLKEFRYVEFVLIDDGSTDSTFLKFKEFLSRVSNSRAVRLSKHQGSEIAVVAGLDLAIGDYIVTLEYDRDPVAAAIEIAKKVVSTGRVHIGHSNIYSSYPALYRGLRRSFFYFIHKLGVDLPEGTTLLVGLPRSAVTLLQRSKEKFRFLRLINQTIGIPYELWDYEQNLNAPTKGLGSALSLGLNVVIHQGDALIRFASVTCIFLGIFGSSVSLVALVFGVISLSAGLIAVVCSFVFMILFVLLEYQKAIFNQVRGVDLYHILEDRTSAIHPDLRNTSAGEGRHD